MLIRLSLLQLIFVTALFAAKINVAAAANLIYALPELKSRFLQNHPGTDIRFTVGGSGKLAIQIERGAAYDVFLSANTDYVRRLYQKGKTLQEPKVYAQGALVLLSAKKRDFSKGIKLLLQKEIKRVAIANPKTAPYGKASLEALKNAGIYDRIKPKIVYAESISQTLIYTLKAADAGLVAKSALYSPKLRRYMEGENWVDVPQKFYTPIAQAAVLLIHAKGNEDAKAFYEFLFSDTAKAIFKKYGYSLP